MRKFQIESNSYTNVLLLSDKEFTNSPCTIHINNSSEIDLSLLVAIASSPVIANELLSDISKRDFYFDVPFINNVSDSLFDKLSQALHMQEVNLNDEEIMNFALFGQEIGNPDFLLPLKEQFDDLEANLNENNCIESLLKKLAFNLDPSAYSREISLLAENFEQKKDDIYILAKEVKLLPIIRSIVSSPCLKLKNENSLLEFIIQLCHIDNIYEQLFEYVWLEYCSVLSIHHFITYMDRVLDTTKNMRPMLKCMIRRLIESHLPMNPNYFKERHDKPSNNEDDFIYVTDNDPLNGILRREGAKGNVVMKASSTLNGSVYDIICADSEADFYTNDVPQSWIKASLKNNKPFRITKYMIRGHIGSSNFLQSWKLEGKRVKDNQWIEIDSHENEPFTKLGLKVFSVSCADLLSAVRLTQTSTNVYGNNYFHINAFDIFGEYEP